MHSVAVRLAACLCAAAAYAHGQGNNTPNATAVRPVCPVGATYSSETTVCMDSYSGCYLGARYDRRTETCSHICPARKMWSTAASSCVPIECPRGWDWSPDTETCVSSATCPVGHGLFHGVCVDINECKQQRVVCGAMGQCFNIVGSYVCVCPVGYALADGVCADVDECNRAARRTRMDRVCPERATCKNTQGSYRCICNEGYVGEATDCVSASESTAISEQLQWPTDFATGLPTAAGDSRPRPTAVLPAPMAYDLEANTNQTETDHGTARAAEATRIGVLGGEVEKHGSVELVERPTQVQTGVLGGEVEKHGSVELAERPTQTSEFQDWAFAEPSTVDGHQMSAVKPTIARTSPVLDDTLADTQESATKVLPTASEGDEAATANQGAAGGGVVRGWLRMAARPSAVHGILLDENDRKRTGGTTAMGSLTLSGPHFTSTVPGDEEEDATVVGPTNPSRAAEATELTETAQETAGPTQSVQTEASPAEQEALPEISGGGGEEGTEESVAGVSEETGTAKTEREKTAEPTATVVPSLRAASDIETETTESAASELNETKSISESPAGASEQKAGASEQKAGETATATEPVESQPPSPTTAAYCDGLVDKNGLRVRREWREMSVEQQRMFFAALRYLFETGQWEDVMWYHWHPNTNVYGHVSNAFLPWHRYYLLLFEDQLRSLHSNFSCLTLPYWDWTQDVQADPNAVPRLTVVEDFGGISRTCMFDESIGPIRYSFPNEKCVTRRLDAGWRPPGPLEMLDMSVSSQTFADMNALIKGWHAWLHIYIGGRGGTMNDITNSPNDPIFWPHHAMIDKLWAMWQGCQDVGAVPQDLGKVSPKVYDVDEDIKVAHGFDDVMAVFPTRVTPRMVNNILELGYTYSADVLETTIGGAMRSFCRGQVPWLADDDGSKATRRRRQVARVLAETEPFDLSMDGLALGENWAANSTNAATEVADGTSASLSSSPRATAEDRGKGQHNQSQAATGSARDRRAKKGSRKRRPGEQKHPNVERPDNKVVLSEALPDRPVQQEHPELAEKQLEESCNDTAVQLVVAVSGPTTSSGVRQEKRQRGKVLSLARKMLMTEVRRGKTDDRHALSSAADQECDLYGLRGPLPASWREDMHLENVTLSCSTE